MDAYLKTAAKRHEEWIVSLLTTTISIYCPSRDRPGPLWRYRGPAFNLQDMKDALLIEKHTNTPPYIPQGWRVDIVASSVGE